MGKASDSGSNLGDLANKIYSLLRELQPEDRIRVLTSVAQLFGDPPVSASSTNPPGPGAGTQKMINPGSQAGSSNPQQYFAKKSPQNKGEMLAVAAKYREEHGGGHSHTRDDLAKFFTDARQNFDRNHFPRDMKNAQNQAQLFNKGTPRGQYQLSYFGQQYVDLLPDREALKKLRRPGKKKANRKTAKGGASK
jgi:hypothetical protein